MAAWQFSVLHYYQMLLSVLTRSLPAVSGLLGHRSIAMAYSQLHLPGMSNNAKMMLSAGAYFLAAYVVASVAEKKNFKHVFRQLGSC